MGQGGGGGEGTDHVGGGGHGDKLLGGGDGAEEAGLRNLMDGLGGGGGADKGGLSNVVHSMDGLRSSSLNKGGGRGSSTDNSRLGNAVHKSLRGSSGAHNSGGGGSMDDVSSSRLGAGSNHSLGRGSHNSLGGGSSNNGLGLLRGIEGDGNRALLAIVGHGSLESILSISGVLDHTDTAIGVSNRVGSPDNISLPALLPGLGVTGAGIGNRVAKVVAGIGINHLFLLLDNVGGDGNRGGTHNGLLHGVGNGLDAGQWSGRWRAGQDGPQREKHGSGQWRAGTSQRWQSGGWHGRSWQRGWHAPAAGHTGERQRRRTGTGPQREPAKKIINATHDITFLIGRRKEEARKKNWIFISTLCT